ncbi:hypothetical protein WR25_27057 [Diploscapter pachys]|uniref:Uncharacterized protein n=1 Tax=Diploscapter pachys TaxID=2018661 RepID=A0A2A2KCT5_9BILA|nr:hypothetical protein WR25_27057 [Diploscapter pachys]
MSNRLLYLWQILPAQPKQSKTSPLEEPTTCVYNDNVPVRRVSLAEFTGLEPQEKLDEISQPSWKCSVSPSSLLSSYSARRRSVLSTDVPDSPSKKLTPQREESIETSAAIDRITLMQERLSKLDHNDNHKGAEDKQVVHEIIERISNCLGKLTQSTNDLAGTSRKDEKAGFLITELVDTTDRLLVNLIALLSHLSVYHSELLQTELTQTLKSLLVMLKSFEEASINLNRDATRLISSLAQLNRAIHTIRTK